MQKERNKNKYTIYSDGGSRGNPGPAGCGIFIVDSNGKPLEKRYKYIGVATNNIAEYTAILLGISRAIELGAASIEVRADSKLAIEQLSGNFKVKNPDLKSIFDIIGEKISNWGGEVKFVHIPREKNKEADRLANVAMDVGECKRRE
ncbi:ribonuclease H [Candidatus Gracilibacteria bacterium]|nr:MAG: ribonuclease H [Candidatus Gracilibacteria bacterium]